MTYHSRSTQPDLASGAAVDDNQVDEFSFTTDNPELGDLRTLIESRGLKPDDWVVVSTTLNTWQAQAKEGVIQDLQQWKVTLRRAPRLILAAPAQHIPSIRKRPQKRSQSATRPELTVVLADHQAPYHDPNLHQATLNAIQDFKKLNLTKIVHAGDLLDLPTISRHAPRAGDVEVQPCIQAGYDIWRDLSEAAPNTQRLYVPGNHEYRLQSYLLEKAGKIYGITPAEIGNGAESPVFGLKTLLHLDKLGVELIESPLGWMHGEVVLVDGLGGLVVRHGWLTSANSAEKSLLKRGRSIIFGHLHRRQTVYHYDASANLERQAHCLGTMSLTRDSRYPSYVACDDWTPGFATITTFPDGQWTVDHAIWNGAQLIWRDRVWTV